METYINRCQENSDEHELSVNRTTDFKSIDNFFDPKALANKLLLNSGFSEGTLTKVKYKNGKLKISFKHD